MTKTAKQSGVALFAKQAFTDFSTFGAIIPTTGYAARRMVESIAKTQTGYVVELGAGTGVITAALQEQLSDPQKVIALEQSAELTEYIKKRCPLVHAVHGDAKALVELLGEKADKVHTVVSALPFRLMSESVADEILTSICDVLPDNGQLVQITYSWRKQHHPSFQKFLRLLSSKNVWFNLPPARIDTYTKR